MTVTLARTPHVKHRHRQGCYLSPLGGADGSGVEVGACFCLQEFFFFTVLLSSDNSLVYLFRKTLPRKEWRSVWMGKWLTRDSISDLFCPCSEFPGQVSPPGVVSSCTTHDARQRRTYPFWGVTARRQGVSAAHVQTARGIYPD